MSILLDLKKVMKKSKLKKEHKVKDYIRKTIQKNELNEMRFIQDFVEIAELKRWYWFRGPINVETVTEHLVNDVYRIVKVETDYYFNNKKWSDRWIITFIGSGRLVVAPAEFEDTKEHIWFELSFLTTL